MKAYVASSVKNIRQVRQVYKMLRSLEYEITHDWTKDLNGKKSLWWQAIDDEAGVLDSDVFILLNHPACVATYTELGLALTGHFRQIIVVDSVVKFNVFFHSMRVMECKRCELKAVLTNLKRNYAS